MGSQQEDRNLEQSVKGISKGFVMVGKSRVKWVYAWLVIVLVLGIGVGIGYVANSGNLSSGEAAWAIPNGWVRLPDGVDAVYFNEEINTVFYHKTGDEPGTTYGLPIDPEKDKDLPNSVSAPASGNVIPR